VIFEKALTGLKKQMGGSKKLWKLGIRWAHHDYLGRAKETEIKARSEGKFRSKCATQKHTTQKNRTQESLGIRDTQYPWRRGCGGTETKELV
jgi:hypothetical protein